jgi:uncharacterized C2H2 Zn-finger protein
MEYNKNSEKFICEKCDFFSSNRKDYKRHINTIKHKEVSKQSYKCGNCAEIFKSKTSLWRHNKNCCINSDKKFIYTENDVKHLKDKIDELQEDKIARLERDNNLYIERENKILQLTEQLSNNTTNNISNNVNSNNNTFNLNFFLTNTCKDAMNINEFIESIEVSIEDLKYLGKNGYVEGISKLIIDKLQQIDVTRRPLHCSDLKREIIHVKDKNEWTKEVKRGEKIDNVLMEVKRKNTIALVGKYQEKYPQCLTNYNSKEHKEYGEIIHQNFGGKTEDINFQDDKILRRVSKYIEINKNKNKKNK